MEVQLNPEQRAKLERVACHAGKPPAQVLTETAFFLLEHDLAFWESIQRGFLPVSIQNFSYLNSSEQNFLPAEDLDARLAQILRR